MSKFNDAYLTDAGVELLTRSIAEDFKIEFVKMIVGDGIYRDQDKTKEKIVKMSELKSKRQECGFSYIGITENDTVMLKAVIENADVEDGYRITEIGIVAKKSGDATSNGILYSLAVAEEADFLPPKTTPISYIQEYYTKIHNSENVTINVKMGAYATAEDLNKVMYPKYDTAESLGALISGERLEKAFGKIKKAIDIFIDHIVLKASKTVLGHVKVSDSETVTDSTGLALAATEKNEEIPGTIASKVRALDEGLINHKSSADHDGRYLKKAEVVNNNTTTAAGYALDARQANPNVAGSLGAQILTLISGLTSHKTSGDHDGRYYTEAEVNNLLARYYLKADVDNKIINAKPSVNNISSNAAVTIGSGSTADIIINVAAGGRTPILATCIDTGNHMCYLCATSISGNNVTIRLKNISTVGSVSCRPTVRVLYTTN